jgi:3',5'-cyclic AMP phosphodiesterase CpdA
MRFAVISDLHIALPETIWDNPKRFHQVEVSIPALKHIVEQLTQAQIDFVLMPGDLTQHGEPSNHLWLSNYLKQLPFPVYVIPGNHDVPVMNANETSIAWQDFPHYYEGFGYQAHHQELYYTHSLNDEVQLIALNSNNFDGDGYQQGYLDQPQLQWLEQVLAKYQHKVMIVMVHHNVLEHLPGQSDHDMGRRYMLDNAPTLKQLLKKYGVQFVFTGHLHVQHITEEDGLWEITTGSLVTYPHPYRLIELSPSGQLNVTSHHVTSLPEFPNLSADSREWIGDRSAPFMAKLLTSPPLNKSLEEVSFLLEPMRYFWADLAAGDNHFNFVNFPEEVKNYLHQFNDFDAQGQLRQRDNNVIIHGDRDYRDR